MKGYNLLVIEYNVENTLFTNFKTKDDDMKFYWSKNICKF